MGSGADCLDVEVLAELQRGSLSQDHASTAKSHIESCPSCTAALEGLTRDNHGGRRRRSAPRISIDTVRADSGAAAGAEHEVRSGTAIGRYMILNRLGAGGMGVVYAAYDPTLDRRVALKLVSSHVADERGQEALLLEAQAMASLSHPNVVPVFDVGTADHGVFMAMELVDGQNLRAWLDERPRSWREVIQVFVSVARGLAAAHATGLIHRDVKPENVLVGAEGRVRIGDFGLAMFGQNGPFDGSFAGTPPYMAPEQFASKPADAYTDQFGFAVTLYEALYGGRPFAHKHAPAAAELDWTVPPAPRDRRVPPHLHRILVRALSVDPARRYPSMDALIAELSHDPAARRRRIALAGLALAGIAGVGIGAARLSARDAALCEGAERDLAGVWDAPRQLEIAAAFGASGGGPGAAAWQRVQHSLDDYARHWTTMRTDACKDTRVRGVQSDEALSLRTICLEESLTRLGGLTELLSHADRGLINRAPKAVSALPTIARCGDLKTLRTGVKPPDDPTVAGEVQALRKDISRAHALFDTGKYDDAKAAGQQLVTRAKRVSYLPVQAEAQLLLGIAQSQNAEPEAEATLKDVILQAEASHDDEVAAEAWMNLLLFAAERARFQDGAMWSRFAEAAVARVGDPDELRARLLTFEGHLESRAEHYDRAAELLLEAIKVRHKIDSNDDLRTASIYNLLGNVYDSMGKAQQALELIEKSLAIKRASLGDHPDVVDAYTDMALVLTNMGRFDEGLRALDAAEQMWKRLGLAETENYLFMRGNRAAAYIGLGRMADAEELLLALKAPMEASFGQDNPLLALWYQMMGRVRLQRGDPRGALDHLERARQMLEKSEAGDTPDSAGVLAAMAKCWLALGSPAKARPPAEDAVKIFSRHPGTRSMIGDARWTLVRALATDPASSQRGAELARLAVDDFKVSGHTGEEAEVEAWLASHVARR